MAVKHSTASVFLFRCFADGWRLGLIRHPRLGRLMIAGGHVEAEETAADAAVREVAEETGLACRLLHAPAPRLPEGFPRSTVPLPWWIVEHPVPPDPHAPEPHVHVDHVYVALASRDVACSSAAHPFGWYDAAEIAESEDVMEDTRLQAKELFARIDGFAAVAAGGASDRAAEFWRSLLV